MPGVLAEEAGQTCLRVPFPDVEHREEDRVGGCLNLRCLWDITTGPAGTLDMTTWGRGDQCLNE